MPTRRKPNSNPTRDQALTIGKEMKETIPPPLIIPFAATTIARLDSFFPNYKSKIVAGEAALQLQFFLGEQIKPARQMAEWLISDFYDALQRAVRRGRIDASERVRYGLDGTDASLPTVNSEADINFWGGKAAVGEAARIAAGGLPITYPPIAEVTAGVNSFKDLNYQQANAKLAYAAAQEELAALNPEADKLILKMWNEIETAFDEGDKPSMRQKAREWGVIYVPLPGEAPSPDEFSIIGTITDSVTGLPIEDADLHIMPADAVVLTDDEGKFYVAVLAAGSYNVTIHKAGYLDKTIPGVIVTAGAITTLNATLATAIGTGTISGNVNAPGFPPATVSVAGTGLTATTDPMGNFTITGVTAGMVSLNCFLDSDPANIKTATPTVVAGATVTVNFSFP